MRLQGKTETVFSFTAAQCPDNNYEIDLEEDLFGEGGLEGIFGGEFSG